MPCVQCEYCYKTIVTQNDLFCQYLGMYFCNTTHANNWLTERRQENEAPESSPEGSGLCE